MIRARAGGEDAFEAAAPAQPAACARSSSCCPGWRSPACVLFWASAHFIPSDLADLIVGCRHRRQVEQRGHGQAAHLRLRGHAAGLRGQGGKRRQSLNDPKVLTFTAIDAHIGLDDASTATVGAATGIYNGNDNTLQLKDGIVIETTSGYSASIESAAIDLGKGSLVPDHPIELRTKDGTLRANAVEVSERGKHVLFKGGVSVTYLPPANSPRRAEPQ